MIDPQAVLFLFLFGLSLDLVLTAAKAAYVNARYEKLLTQRVLSTRARRLTDQLLSRRTRLMTNLQTSHVILRFLLAGVAVTLYVVSVEGPVSLLVLFGVVLGSAFFTAILEQSVESRVLLNPEAWAVRLAGFTRGFLIVLSPLLLIPRLFARLLPEQPGRFYRVTEDELNLILDAGEREGVLEVDEREMIQSIFLFKDTTAREIMVPRIDLLSIDEDTPLLEAIDSMLESGYSRVPVFKGSIDNIIGVLYIKDLLRQYRAGQHEDTLQETVRPAYFIPESKKVGELLAEMQAQRNHIAIVVDEYGGVAGIVTLEDIVEEIVGEIQDEYDEAEELLVQQVREGEYMFQAKIDISAVNEVLGTNLPKETADTLGGLLYAWFGRIPRVGETAESDDILFIVEQVTGRRIRKVRAQRSAPAENASAALQDPART